MNYEEFKNYVQEHLLEVYKSFKTTKEIGKDKIIDKLPEVDDNTEVVIQKIVKNNGIQLDAVSIFFEDRKISPNIYLNPYYNSYIVGTSMDIIMYDIIERYISELDYLSCEHIDLYDYDKVKDRIVIRLINYEKNKDMLENCVYERYLDLAVTYRYVVEDDRQGLASILITDKEFSQWNIEQSELYEKALNNTKLMYPYITESLTAVAKECLDKMVENYMSDEEKALLRQTQIPQEMYILTNQSKAFGAGCILYDNFLYNFSKVNNANILILPSSVHETMLIPECDGVDPLQLREVLNEVNMQSIGFMDYLSDNIYYYDRVSDEIKIYEFAEEKSA